MMLAAAAVLPALPAHPPLLCPLKTITGVPCPFCGMTTSVEATVHLRFGDALAASPAGVLLVVAATIFLVRRPAAVRVPLGLVFGVLALMWACSPPGPGQLAVVAGDVQLQGVLA
jgi:hypothetical protein